jgi:hypothetical protein
MEAKSRPKLPPLRIDQFMTAALIGCQLLADAQEFQTKSLLASPNLALFLSAHS